MTEIAPHPADPAQPIVQMTGIVIEFPGVRALDGVDFRLFPGEVHSLMGENGAGKSTLIKALTGVYPIDSGEIVVAGAPRTFAGPAHAQEAGISTVYQEVNLLPNLTVAENIMLGREPRRRGGIDWSAMRARAAQTLSRLNLDIDPASALSSHSLAVQQLVAIARSMDIDAKVLILDEPTSSLDADEVAELFRVIRGLRDDGVAILFVSHFLDQVYEIADRLTVLRNGHLEGEYLTRELLRIDLVQKMIGKELATLDSLEQSVAEEGDHDDAEPFLTATGLGKKGAISPTDLTIGEGEVVGLAGLLGSGRTELARLIGGIDRADEGRLVVTGSPAPIRTPRHALRRRIAFATEDRRAEGIIGDLTVRDNIVLALQADRGWFRRVPKKRQAELADSYIKALNIRPANPDALVRNLSGGNQQKVLLARWLAVAPRLLILDEPTRGIDVGAKAEIQKLVYNLAENGMSVLFISAELEEVLRLSHRIGVLRDRKLISTVTNNGLTVDNLLALIAEGSTDDADSAVHEGSAAMNAVAGRIVTHRLFWPVVLLVALLVVNVVAFPGFLTVTLRDGHLFGSTVDILRNGAPTLLIAIGMTLVIATRGIDLSVGAVCAIAGALACSIIIGSPNPDSPVVVITAVAVALAVGLVLGLWNGLLVSVLGIQPIVATLILMTAGRGVAMLITEGQILTVNSAPFKVIGSGFLFGIPIAVVIAVAVVALTALLTRRTALGMLIESVGVNPEASRQAGVRARGLILGVYAFCAFLAAIAGLILTSNQTAADANNTGLFIELDAILAVVIGGTSLVGGRYSLAGTVIGALVIQTLVTTVYTVGIPPIATMVFKAAVVIAVFLLQSPTTTAALSTWRRRLTPSVPKEVQA